MKIALLVSAGLLVATSAFAGPAMMTDKQLDTVFAGTQPANPGGFGQDRAAWIHANGGEAWGDIAPTRAGDNGAINNAYKIANGDLPAGVTPGQ
ncbi:MAG TPA: hypothetical protein VFI23_11735 [Rhizomicrobium sp.]|nr:hypothetical protein [Rhizomicrobium sp.]